MGLLVDRTEREIALAYFALPVEFQRVAGGHFPFVGERLSCLFPETDPEIARGTR